MAQADLKKETGAAAGPQPMQSHVVRPPLTAVDMIIPGFLLLCLLAAMVAMFWLLRRLKRQSSYLQRGAQHMDRMEAKSDRMIELLESIQRKLDQTKP
jgi:hypothetical protein